MEIQRLKEFMKIARCESVSEAARDLYMTHQTLSSHLKSLEAEVGHPLIIRGSSNRLTPYGSVLLDAASEITESYDALLRKVKDLERQRCGAVRFISYDTTPFIELLHSLKKSLEDDGLCAQIEFDVLDKMSSQNAVRSEKVDIGFKALFGKEAAFDEEFQRDFEFVELTAYRDHLYFFIPKSNALYDEDEITFHRIMQEAFAVPVYHDKGFLLEGFREFCRNEGCEPVIRYIGAANSAEFYLAPKRSSVLFMTGTLLNSLIYKDLLLSETRPCLLSDRDCTARAYAFWKRGSANSALPDVVRHIEIIDAQLKGKVSTALAENAVWTAQQAPRLTAPCRAIG